MKIIISISILLLLFACTSISTVKQDLLIPDADFVLTNDQTHNKFSRSIPYVVKVPSGSVIEAYMLCSLVGDLKIAETVNHPHMLVTMHAPKHIFK